MVSIDADSCACSRAQVGGWEVFTSSEWSGQCATQLVDQPLALSSSELSAAIQVTLAAHGRLVM